MTGGFADKKDITYGYILIFELLGQGFQPAGAVVNLDVENWIVALIVQRALPAVQVCSFVAYYSMSDVK